MRRSFAVYHRRASRRVVVARLVAPLLSLYVMVLFGVIPLHGSARVAQQHPLPERVSTETSQSKLPDSDTTQIKLVSEMIESEVPAHPDKHSLAEIIVSESLKADVDPLFIAAIVRAESMFRHKAVSRRGAQGLMQIMPATGRFISKVSKIELKDITSLHNPETNIRLGVWYVRYLLTKFKGDRTQMLVAYNWGPSNALKAIANRSLLPRESVQYVHKVLSHHTTWTERRNQFAALRADSSLG